ncbi:MAG: hypothetical protein JEY71_07680 [Sphaerochaeta sp.]|nr:hypothetical protein [Sphaerochaeta sp.]
MKKVIYAVCLLLVILLNGNLVANSIEAISVEQLFTDGVKREGQVTVAAPVLTFEVEKNPFDDTIINLTLTVGEKGRSLSVFFDDYNNFNIEEIFIGKTIALVGTVILTGNSGIIKGEILTNDFYISEYRAPYPKSNLGIRQIEVNQYFDDELFVGSEKVVISGVISERLMAADGTVLFLLSDLGREIYAYSSYNFDINKNSQELRAHDVGDKISLFGSFDMESSFMTIFTFTKIM